jgi:hypothetical protein
MFDVNYIQTLLGTQRFVFNFAMIKVTMLCIMKSYKFGQNWNPPRLFRQIKIPFENSLNDKYLWLFQCCHFLRSVYYTISNHTIDRLIFMNMTLLNNMKMIDGKTTRLDILFECLGYNHIRYLFWHFGFAFEGLLLFCSYILPRVVSEVSHLFLYAFLLKNI